MSACSGKWLSHEIVMYKELKPHSLQVERADHYLQHCTSRIVTYLMLNALLYMLSFAPCYYLMTRHKSTSVFSQCPGQIPIITFLLRKFPLQIHPSTIIRSPLPKCSPMQRKQLPFFAQEAAAFNCKETELPYKSVRGHKAGSDPSNQEVLLKCKTEIYAPSTILNPHSVCQTILIST